MLAGTLLLAAVLPAAACSIPVFRYALDRWAADPYLLEVTPAAAKDETVARFLRNLGTSSPFNLTSQRLPPDAATSRLLSGAGRDGRRTTVWSGALEPAVIESLTTSPTRAGLVERILAGHSAVWVFVGSGDRAADDAAVARLEKRLRYLEQVAQLPVIDPNDPTSKLGPGPQLQVKFSVLRLDPADAAEAPLRQMLAGPKAAEVTGGAWLAAVFGRGRVLGAWPAAGFGDEQVEEVCLFLLGACSCQVKNLNPGWDLLLKVDWEAGLQRASELAPAAATAAARPLPSAAVAGEQPETVTIQSGGAPPAPPAAPVSPRAPVGLLLVAGLALLAGVWLWFGAQSKS